MDERKERIDKILEDLYNMCEDMTQAFGLYVYIIEDWVDIEAIASVLGDLGVNTTKFDKYFIVNIDYDETNNIF